MPTPTSFAHRLVNGLHALLLLGGMGLLVAYVGWFVAGAGGMGAFLVIGLAFLFISPRFSPRLVLRLYGARPLSQWEAPGLTAMVQELAARAGVGAPPGLHYIPSAVMNAFSVGRRAHAAIAVTDGLLRNLSSRELSAVLAHEIAHVRANDIWIMGLADSVSRLVWLGSLFGQAMLAVNLPLLLMREATLPWWPILMLLAAPTLSALLQLGLSRNREFEADRVAASLTADPRGLAIALEKLEHHQRGLLQRLLLPGHHEKQPSLLRTHPASEERIQRLLDLEQDFRTERVSAFASLSGQPGTWPASLSPEWPPVTRRPGRRWSGIWY